MILYRIVLTDPPTLDNFTSDEGLGIPAVDADPERLRLRSGISTYGTENQAQRKARDYPHFGQPIAALKVPDEGRLRFARTTRSRGHHTLWGEPSAILSCLVAVRPVAELA